MPIDSARRISNVMQTLARAAEHLKREYYHAYYGWDSRQEWIACMMLLQEAHRLIRNSNLSCVESFNPGIREHEPD